MTALHVPGTVEAVPRVKINAFQRNAFQNNAFQILGIPTGDPGGYAGRRRGIPKPALGWSQEEHDRQLILARQVVAKSAPKTIESYVTAQEYRDALAQQFKDAFKDLEEISFGPDEVMPEAVLAQSAEAIRQQIQSIHEMALRVQRELENQNAAAFMLLLN